MHMESLPDRSEALAPVGLAGRRATLTPHNELPETPGRRKP